MKSGIILLIVTFLCSCMQAQIVSHSATGETTTQDSDGDLSWDIDSADACEAVDANESNLSGLAGVLATSNTLNINDFTFASFPATSPVASAQLDLRVDVSGLLDISPDFTVNVIRDDGMGGETTLLTETSSHLLSATSLVTIGYGGASAWDLTGLTGTELNASSFRVEVVVDIDASVAYNYGIDEVELQFTTDAALPVKWGAIEAEESKEGAVITWNTEVESGNAYFSVEKSFNAKEWKPFETVKAAGNSYLETEYEVFDPSPYTPATYYRIKQVDYDGRYQYSEIVSLKMSPKPHLKPIVVNPVIDQLVIQNLPTDMKGSLDITVVDICGRVLLQRRLSGGVESLVMDYPFSPGSYYLLISSEQTKKHWTFPLISH